MAKHVKGTKQGSKVSKGLRKSCNKLASKPVQVNQGDTNNAMRTAFLATAFPDSIRFSALGQMVIRAVQQEPKRSADDQRGWGTKLTFRTFHKLKADGILA